MCIRDRVWAMGRKYRRTLDGTFRRPGQGACGTDWQDAGTAPDGCHLDTVGWDCTVKRSPTESDDVRMTLRTAFTEYFSVTHPVALAPMGDVAGGALAAAVSNGGGLGLVGGGRADRSWFERELAIVIGSTDRPWGVGFLSWALDVETIRWTLEHGPKAIMLSFGDPSPFADAIRDSSAKLIIQVTDLDEARRALDVGADVIVAQGTEAGGHGGRRATLPLVPAVVDLVTPTPVLAAGGVADGRGLAAALMLGAAGALIGTRFEASLEVLVPASTTKSARH